jgi:type II secretory pathway pseudopilin PulG
VTPTRRAARQRGFTLAEIAIVFLIVALLIGGAVLTFSAQNEAREIADTQRTLEQAREAIIGFALRNGRLPCPAPGGGVGTERFCNAATGACTPPAPVDAVMPHGRCAAPNGFVPAATLGIGPIETNPASPNFGLLLDSWLQPIRYSVTQVDVTPPPAAPSNVMLFTAANQIKANVLATPAVIPDLAVCTTSAGANAAGVAPNFLPLCGGALPGFQTPAVVYSTGKNFAQQLPAGPAGGADEQANIHFGAAFDRIFVAHEPRPGGAVGGAFDDLVIWVSPNILYNRMIAAGAL